MPKYRNISIHLCADTADGELPERPRLAKGVARLTPLPVILEVAPPTAARHSPTKCLTPLLQDDEKAQISVYVPMTPKALFWVAYRIEPPPVDGTFYVFKLLVNREEVVTWSCDASNKFKGKTMFGLFDTHEDEGGQELEKRLFRFGTANDMDTRIVGDLSGDKEEDRFVEVRVFRAKAKKRIEPVVRNDLPATGPGLELVNGGQLKSQAPQRYYKFGLIDPVDKPYAAFRFYYRTWEEIDKLDLRMGEVDEGENSPFQDSDNTATVESNYERQNNNSVSRNLRATTTSQARNSDSPQSISGAYFSSYPNPHPQAVYAAQPYPPGASFSNQRAMPPQIPQYPAAYPAVYAPLPLIAPPRNPYSWQTNSGYAASVSPAAASPYDHLQDPYAPLTSSSTPTQSHSNFTMPNKRLSIPPQLLFQPLISKGPLPPSPTKLAQREMEAQRETEIGGKRSGLWEMGAEGSGMKSSAQREVKTKNTMGAKSFAQREADAKKEMEQAMGSLKIVDPTLETEILEASRGRSPKKLLKRRSEEKVSSGGTFRLFDRLRSKSRDRENGKAEE